MERSAFTLFAELADRHWWFLGRRALYLPLLDEVLRRDGVVPGPGLSVLDVGCGVGGFLRPLAPFGTVTGLELDEPSVAFCRGQGLPRTLVAASDRLPVRESSQDLLCLWDVLEHTPDDRAVLAEMRRCLRPGGHLAISVPAYQWLYANNDRFAHHFRRYTRGELVGKLRAAGLEVRKATYVNFVLGVGIIPAVLLLKLKERLLGAPENSNNLDVSVPRPLNALLAGIFGGERHLLRHVSAPFGHSLLVIARRPPARAEA